MRIIDRYVIREVLLPFVIALLVFTFILIVPSMMQYAEAFIAKGVPTSIVLRAMATLLPSSLALSIPSALLIALLIAFGRLSADREFVAMQACGISVARLLRPVAFISIVGWGATSYVMLEALPDANQAFREIAYNVLAQRAEGEVKPRVFFDEFPDLVLYVRDIPPAGGWNDVFMADNTPGRPQAIYLVRHGRVLLDQVKRKVEMVLEDGTRHVTNADGTYQVVKFDRQVISVSPERAFPRGGPQKGDPEMTIAELKERAAEFERQGLSSHNQIMAIHRKFAIPVACLVFGVIGLALGATNRRDGKLGSFVFGLGVIFAYYIPLTLGPALAKGHLIPPWLAVWAPNIILSAVGAALFLWRSRAADQEFRFAIPRWLQPRSVMARRTTERPVGVDESNIGTPGLLGRLLPTPTILDRYVTAMYVRVFALCALGLLALFYISTFIDRSDKVFKGAATWSMMGDYLWYLLPQYVYFVLPMSVLLASLVTIGVLTKNSELIVMKACGISLYRVAVPMLGAALVAGGTLFALEQTILGEWNRKADSIKAVMNGVAPATLDMLTRQWVVGSQGNIYHYNFFDPGNDALLGLSVFEFSNGMRSIAERSYAERARYEPVPGHPNAWRAEQTWTREFTPSGDTRRFSADPVTQFTLEPPSYFGTRQPEPQFMSYSQLRTYIEQLRTSGFDVIAQQVALERKASFPFVTVIMTLLAVPFAVSAGRRGAMYGVGAGIVIAITYWVAFSVFAALGTGGVVAPTLAAWAPNLLFGAGAAYLLLTVRT
jgi:LPS export ABC transporter permease LptG/LPS export ABC transporter permease LptF